MYTHIQQYVHTYARTHAHTHTLTHTCIHRHTSIFAHEHKHTYKHIHKKVTNVQTMRCGNSTVLTWQAGIRLTVRYLLSTLRGCRWRQAAPLLPNIPISYKRNNYYYHYHCYDKITYGKGSETKEVRKKRWR